MSIYTTTGTTTAPTATTRTGGSRWGTRRSSGSGALAKNAMEKPVTKFVDWRYKSGERWGVANAKVSEKLERAEASVSYGAFAVSHLFRPIRRRAAKDAEKNKKSMYHERRLQEEAAVHSRAAAKRAASRQSRMDTLNQAVH